MNKNTKKVTLVSAGISRKEYPQFARFMPMTAVGLHYIKAVLENQGYKINIVNQTNDDLSNDETTKLIDETNPDIVLFNQFFSTRKRIREEIISNLKKDYIIGVGGHDATFHSKSLTSNDLKKEYSQFDFIWQGEAEKSLADFLSKINNKQETPIIGGNLEDRVGQGITQRIGSLDKSPILKHDDYKGDISFLVTSRGCLPIDAACGFCTTGQFYPDGWRSRSVEHVIPELDNIKKNNKNYVFIVDDNFLGFNKEHLERGNKIIEYASKLGLKLMIMTTKEQIINADKVGYLNNWKGTVFRALLGIENGSKEAALKLDKCSARHDLEYTYKCRKAISALYDNGISLFGGYINFNPSTTFEELEESARFLKDNGREAANFTNLTQGLRFYEGTRICEKYPEQSRSKETINGEPLYDFEDSRVRELYIHLSNVRHSEEGLMERLDSINYELTDLVHINQIQDDELGENYFNLAEKLNQHNYDYFIDCCNRLKKGERLESDGFLYKSGRILEEYVRIYENIRNSVEHK